LATFLELSKIMDHNGVLLFPFQREMI